MVKWLIEKNVFDEEVENMVQIIQDQRHECKFISYVPFEGSDKFLSLFDEEDCVIFYGSLQMANEVKRKAKWIPGLYCNLPAYECSFYYPYFGYRLLNEKYIMLPFGELNRRKDFLLDTLGVDHSLFIRPNSGFKLFTGQVVTRATWEKDLKLLGFYDVDPECLVVVATPFKLAREWRFVIANGKVISGSQYRNKKNKLEKTSILPLSIWDFAQNTVNEVNYSPDKVWVLDICESNNELYVLEVGGFSTAGLYACDMKPIITEVSKIAEEEWNEYNS
jgi:hypothetical protein